MISRFHVEKRVVPCNRIRLIVFLRENWLKREMITVVFNFIQVKFMLTRCPRMMSKLIKTKI